MVLLIRDAHASLYSYQIRIGNSLQISTVADTVRLPLREKEEKCKELQSNGGNWVVHW